MQKKLLTPEQIAVRQEKEQREKLLQEIIRPLRKSIRSFTVDLYYIDYTLKGFQEEFGLVLTPDFQRGHVWTEYQQSHFIENLLRGVVGESARRIQFNAPDWEKRQSHCDIPNTVLCVDGLQRLTAAKRFMQGEIKAFDRFVDAFAGTSFSPRRSDYSLTFEVFDFQTKADLLRHYLDLNAGGTPHSPAEIERVRAMYNALFEPVVESGPGMS